MDIVDALRVAGKPDGRTFEVMSRAAREIEHLREEVEFLRWKVANREFALRCGEERLSTATGLLREWVEYMDSEWDSTPGLLQMMFDRTRVFLNEAEPVTLHGQFKRRDGTTSDTYVASPEGWPPGIRSSLNAARTDAATSEPLRLAAEVECPSCGAHVRFDPTQGAE